MFRAWESSVSALTKRTELAVMRGVGHSHAAMGPTMSTIGRTTFRTSFNVGPTEPLRLVAPLGRSSEQDSSVDLGRRAHNFAHAGADAVQDVTIFGDLAATSAEILAESPIPVGSVLAYEVCGRLRQVKSLTQDSADRIAVDVFAEQIKRGVDYSTVHASLSQQLIAETVAATARRAIPSPSRAAGMLLHVMRRAGIDNPLHSAFAAIAELAGSNGVALSLGSTLRSAALADALDEAQLTELVHQGRLAEICRLAGAPVLLEGLSHASPRDLPRYVAAARRACPHAAVTALGPLPTDIAVGFDHVAAAIGVMLAALAGFELVNVVSAAEHYAMPSEDQMIDALRAARLGRYIATISLQGGCIERDRRMSVARGVLDWKAQASEALFPEFLSGLVDARHLRAGAPCPICDRECPLMPARRL